MTLKKLLLTFSLVLVYFLNFTELKADLINPSSLIKPEEVVKIQLTGLMNNDNKFKDSGIEQTWNFAHPDNKKNMLSYVEILEKIKRQKCREWVEKNASADILISIVTSE